MARISDAAWRAIVSARGSVRGKALWMSPRTMAAIQFERGQDWYPEVAYTLYGVPVRYDDRFPFNRVILEARRNER